MDKRTKIIAITAVALLGVIGLALVWWPESRPQVDPVLVETAAESAREAAKAEPPQPEEVKFEGRARPGPLGGP